MRKREVISKLKELNVYSTSMDVAIDTLIDVDKTIRLLNEGIEEFGTTLTQVYKGNTAKIVVNPALHELSKQQALKSKLLDSLLLTPQSLSKSGIEPKLADGWDEIGKQDN